MPFTKTNPSLYYEKTGHGVPILFIPPPAMGHLTFRYQQELAEFFTVITFDHRGDGESESGGDNLTLTDCLEDINRIFAATQIKQAVIAGYSNGSLFAQQFALQYPEQVLGLILIDGFYHPSNWLLKVEYLVGIAIAKYHGIPILAKGLALSHFPNRQEAKALELAVKKTDTDLLKQQYQLGYKSDLTKQLSRVKVPLLLIYGDQDFYIHQGQYGFRRYVKDVDVAYVHHSAHQVPTRHYMECNAIIYDWMKRKVRKRF
ncbi:alpha/beta fold hydrolase [Gracilibacillus alcaliphilus]|uniref:alpha/beta fold hydrolase n=1 Tax=Gracilibacillus alcaliphilus TaxID=1401441 RepID=UPI00195890BC|nr:alpha/beta hydrolase [Gracilibacillus alcaliphilus]MBM7679665.1 pimeloyl-ACP methyl ester carboxylesterase [Gracilibacillus alcaliphilus]